MAAHRSIDRILTDGSPDRVVDGYWTLAPVTLPPPRPKEPADDPAVAITAGPASTSVLFVVDPLNRGSAAFRLLPALEGLTTTVVPSTADALARIGQSTPDLILVDGEMSEASDRSGTSECPVLSPFKRAAAHVPVIVLLDTLDVPALQRFLQGPCAASHVLAWSVDPQTFRRTVDTTVADCGMGEIVRMLQSLEDTDRSDPGSPERRYVERLARQHLLLGRLRAGSDRVSVSTLSRQFGVSRRTIARDLAELAARGRIPAA